MPILARFTTSGSTSRVELRLDTARFGQGYESFDLELQYSPARATLQAPAAADFSGSLVLPPLVDASQGRFSVSALNFDGLLPAQTPLGSLSFTGLQPAGFQLVVTKLLVNGQPQITAGSPVRLASEGSSAAPGSPSGPIGLAAGAAALTPANPSDRGELDFRSLLDPSQISRQQASPTEMDLKITPAATTRLQSAIQEDGLSLSFNLPAAMGLALLGPSQPVSGLAAGGYLLELANRYLNPLDPYTVTLKQAIEVFGQAAAEASAPSATGQVRLVSFEPAGSVQAELAELGGRASASEFLAVNMWTAGGLRELQVKHLAGVFVVGPGSVQATSHTPIHLVGDSANQTLRGGPGNDYIYAGGGTDILVGGGGSNTFHFAQTGDVVIQDLTPADRLQFSLPAVSSFAELAAKVTGSQALPNGTQYTINNALTISLVGVDSSFPFTESMFVFG